MTLELRENGGDEEVIRDLEEGFKNDNRKAIDLKDSDCDNTDFEYNKHNGNGNDI